MNRVGSMFAKLPFACVLALLTALTMGCYGEVQGDADYPSAAYVATASPVYYEGHPSYWYGNRWYYRNGGGWGSYRSEPRYLNHYRVEGHGYGGRRMGAPAHRYERRR